MVALSVLKARPNSATSKPPVRPLDIIETACKTEPFAFTRAQAWNEYHACFTYVDAWYGRDAARKLYKRVEAICGHKPVNPLGDPMGIAPINPVPAWFDENFASDEERILWEYNETPVQRGPEYVLSDEFREDQEMWLDCGDSVDGEPTYTRKGITYQVNLLATMRKRLREAHDEWDRDLYRQELVDRIDLIENFYGTDAWMVTNPTMTAEQLETVLWRMRQKEYTWEPVFNKEGKIAGSKRLDLKPTIPTPYDDPYASFTQAWTGISTERGSGGRELQFLGQSRFENDEDGWLERADYTALANAIQYGKVDPKLAIERMDWKAFFTHADAHSIVRGLQAILFTVPEMFWDAMNVLEEAVGEFNALTFGGIAESEPFACTL